MQITKVEPNSQEWLTGRLGKVTGSKLHDIYVPPTMTELCFEYLAQGMDDEEILAHVGCAKGTLTTAKKEMTDNPDKFKEKKRKIGFYALMAERLAHEAGDEPPMDRGTRLESEAVAIFSKKIGKEIETGIFCQREDNLDIAVTPDGLIKNNGKYTEALEIKCLSSARHLQAYFEQAVPSEYDEQIIQYFVVNDDLKTLHFMFYDPRIPAMPVHTIEFTREALGSKIEYYRAYQERTLGEINALALQIAF